MKRGVGLGRGTVYNNIVGDSYEHVNPENKALLKEWKMYLYSTDKAETTIDKYDYDFKIWCVWNYKNNKDKLFVDITKRDVVNFQGYCVNLGHSPSRIRSLRSCISSLSNYIEAILDDDYPDFRNIVNKIEAPKLKTVREKLVLKSEEVESLLAVLVEKEKFQQACYLALAGYSGARKSELLRFKVEYFTEDNVENGLYKTSEKIKTKGRGKTGKPLYKWTLKSKFDPYLNLWMQEREKLGIDSEWLFVRKNEGEYVKAKITTADSWAETISIHLGQSFYAHSQRHFYVTELVRAGIPATIIKDIVGWKTESLISLYNDGESSDEFGKYFGEEGIIKQEKKSISDLT